MSGVTHRPAPAVQRIAEKIIPKHHVDLAEADVRIEYIFRSEHAKSNGKAVFGRAKKIGGLNAYLANEVDESGVEGNDGDFFVIEIAEDLWRELTTKQREALVDHELSHCGVTYDKDENLKLVTKPHDLEEFNAIVERHGLWMPSVAEMAKSMQGKLDLPQRGTVEEAVQDLVDAVPDGMKASITANGETTVIADKTQAPPAEGDPSNGSTESAPADAVTTSEDPARTETAPESPEANGATAEEQTEPAVDEPDSSTDDGPAAASTHAEDVDAATVGADADPSAPEPTKATPAQRLALGRHIAALDEDLTDQYLKWCKDHKASPNPEHMTFDQARAALILVGEREPAASAP